MQIRVIRDIGQAIRARRQALGWSQADLASRAGVSRKWVGEAERGETVAGVRNLLAVFEALDLTLELRARDDEGASVPDRDDLVDLDAILAAHRRG